MIDSDYDYVWDTCCDHGLLGRALLMRQASERGGESSVHFVDIVPNLMAVLEQQLLEQFRGDQARWQVYCQDVTTLDLSVFPDKQRHLMVIAGVGGDLAADIVRAVWSRLLDHQRANVEFLLCPVYHQYQLRLDMKALGLKLVSEQLVEDNRRCYELLHLSVEGDQEITSVGDDMWDMLDPAHLQYLRRTIEHYRKVSQGQPSAQTICDAYSAIAPSVIKRL